MTAPQHHSGTATRKPPRRMGCTGSYDGLIRFIMALPETEVVPGQIRSIPRWPFEVRLALETLAECVESLARKLPPVSDWHRGKLAVLYRERQQDLAWVMGDSPRHGLTFAHCAQAAFLVDGWDEEALRAKCLSVVNTVEPYAMRRRAHRGTRMEATG